MKTFLEYVAADLLQKYGNDLSRVAVVFPNKRASLFLSEHLALMAGRPVWSPAYITISDLFRSHSQWRVADPIKLVCDLHKSFTACTGTDETLDHFYGWGQLLLSDFDDVDKNMAPAERVFANVSDLHELDDVSYLTEQQCEILRKFFSNFNQDHTTELKRRFLRLWQHIGDIYHDFNQRLAAQGLAYEGALYRQVALDESIQFEYDTYIFIGFNLLQQVEQTLFRRLCREGKARFYWDFDAYYMASAKNEAGHYIAQYLSDFPNELDNTDADIYDNFRRQKSVTYISAPTENIQARYVSSWLRQDNRLGHGRQTAIVMASEGLLQTVIHSLPEEVDKVNITTGYPLVQTPVASLVTQLITLQLSGYVVQTDRFRLRYVNATLRHPYARDISPLSSELQEQLNRRKIYYPAPSQLALDEGLSLLFTPIQGLLQMVRWMLRLLRHIAKSISAPEDAESTPSAQKSTATPDPLFSESLFRMYTLLNRLADLIESGDLAIDEITFQRLVSQLVSSTSIPFHGEPAEGLQIMGVLETRNIDFRHVLLLSCNEGNLPKGVSDTSFIPYSIRKAYGLTTVDHKVAIYAYYFYRLMQRASDVTILYNKATTNGQTGEMSRFMLQMMVESPHTIRFETLQAGQKPVVRTPSPIQKSAEVMLILQERLAMLSPSAIAKYIRCPLNFFYYYVSDLQEPDEIDEDTIDNRIFGNIFHKAAQNIYERLRQKSDRIMPGDLTDMLKQEVDIARAVDDAFKSELFQIKDPSRPLPPFDGLQIINREVIIKYIRLLLEVDTRLAPFTILGLERKVVMPLQFETGGDRHTLQVGGYVDRLDLVTLPDGSERIRVIDYKTGSRRIKPMPDVDAIFEQSQLRNHSDYYLQAFLYSHILRNDPSQASASLIMSPKVSQPGIIDPGLPVSPCLLFIQHAGGDDYDPTLLLDKQPVSDIADVSERFMQRFQGLVGEIFDPSVPFVPTEDKDRCRNCPYAELCGI